MSLGDGAGGLDRYDAAGGDGEGGGLDGQDDGFLGGASVGDEAVTAVHADVVACAVAIIVLGVGRTRVLGGGIGLQLVVVGAAADELRVLVMVKVYVIHGNHSAAHEG